MAIKGLALALPIGGEKKEVVKKAEGDGSGFEMAADDAFDALKNDDRAAFRSALRDCLELMNAPSMEEDEE